MQILSSKLRLYGVGLILIAAALFALQQTTLGQQKDVAQEPRTTIHWRSVNSTNGITVQRARVPGGWFVSVGNKGQGYVNSHGQGVFFYSDPNHEWDGTSL